MSDRGPQPKDRHLRLSSPSTLAPTSTVVEGAPWCGITAIPAPQACPEKLPSAARIISHMLWAADEEIDFVGAGRLAAHVMYVCTTICSLMVAISRPSHTTCVHDAEPEPQQTDTGREGTSEYSPTRLTVDTYLCVWAGNTGNYDASLGCTPATASLVPS